MIANIRHKLMEPKIAALFFWIGFSIELFIVGVNMGEFEISNEPRLFQIACLFFGIKLILTKYSKKEWIIICIFAGLGTISYLLTRDLFFFRVVVMVLAAKDISNKKALKSLLYLMSGTLFIYGILSITGIFGAAKIVLDFGRGGVETRYCFGAVHPNWFHATVWIIIMLGIYLYFDKMKWFHFIILEFMNIVVFTLTGSRTGIIMGTLVIIIAIILKYCEKFREKKAIYIMGIVLLVSSLIISILFAYYGTTIPVFESLDKIVTGRIGLVYDRVRVGDILLFSGRSNYITTEIEYIQIIHSYGIVFAAIYVSLIALLFRYSYITKKYKNYIILIPLCTVVMIEAYTVLIYIARDFGILLLFGTWHQLFSKNERE